MPAPESERPADQAGQATEQAGARSEPSQLAHIAVALPLLTAFIAYFWIGNMSLLEGPRSKLFLLGAFTVAMTAVLCAAEADKLGMGKVKGKKDNGPVGWFIGILLLWIIGFPLYLYRRSKYGASNLLLLGLLSVVAFVAVGAVLSSAIDQRVAEVRSAVPGVSAPLSRGFPTPLLQQAPKYTRAMFERVADGMPYARVVQIFGDSGHLESSSEVMGSKSEMYSWQNPDGSSAIVMFQDGRVQSMAQTGLR